MNTQNPVWIKGSRSTRQHSINPEQDKWTLSYMVYHPFGTWGGIEKLSNIETLLGNLNKSGGAIVEYQTVVSLILVSWVKPVIRWIPPGGSRRLRGAFYSIPTLFLGWWSVQGFFWTVSALVKNLMGGVDVTGYFDARPGNQTPSRSSLVEIKINRERKLQAWAFLFVLWVILSIAVWFCVLPYI